MTDDLFVSRLSQSSRWRHSELVSLPLGNGSFVVRPDEKLVPSAQGTYPEGRGPGSGVGVGRPFGTPRPYFLTGPLQTTVDPVRLEECITDDPRLNTGED